MGYGESGDKGVCGMCSVLAQNIDNILVAWEKWLTETDDAKRFANQNESNVES